ncbi:MAG: AAA family ATPase [Candidatus Gastranaerophilales bacterium]|nr:AAA family ATPase [Candidatus Gastranaerophilales bacterium]MCM1072421.1 AAA family ATPase [Bacteroides sp.]
MQILNNYTSSTNIKKTNFKANNTTDSELFRVLNRFNDEKSALLFLRQQTDLISPVDINGDHIIHTIVKKDFFETLKQLLQNPKKARELLELRGKDGKTPLAVAQSVKAAKLMIAKGANIYALDDNLEPAGTNPILPEEIRERVSKTTKTQLQQIETPPPSQTVKPKTDTTPLRETIAKESYTKQAESASEPIIEKKKDEPPKQSFFSMFTKKETTETPTQTEQPAVEVKEVKERKEIKIPGTDAFHRIDTPDIPSLEYIAGLEKIKTALRKSVIEPVLDEKIGEELNKNKTTIPNGILISAPPGNGKTVLTTALGAEAQMPVFEISTPEELGQLIEIVEKNYTNTKQRAIIYMRGLDNLYEENTNTGQLTNQLSRIMSDTAKRGSLLIFSVECPDNIPKSILTPGKIDRIMSFKAPDTTARKEYIKRYIKNKELLNNIDITQIADKTQGFSIAQIKHVIDDAVLYSAADKNETISTEELLERIKVFSKEQNIPEIDEYNKTSMYDTVLKRYQPSVYDAKDFESIAGMPSTKSNVEESILKPWQNAEKLRDAMIQLPAGGVFAGDPGTSKTYMAKALARSLEIPLYILKMSEVGSSFVHETSKNIGRIIDQLITKFDETGEASILLMDEIDHFQKGQTQHGAEEVNTLLQEVERGRNKILFIGTTNEVECLPDSLTRDGRMGTVIHFEHCDSKAAGAIIKNLLESRKDNQEISKILNDTKLLDSLAKRCSGMVAASVSAIVNDALADYVINGTQLEEAFDAAVTIRKKKDIEKMLSKSSKDAGHRLNISEDSTIMYDTKYPRMTMGELDPKELEDLGGMEDVKTTLRDEIIDIYQPETLTLLRENRLPITKGFILHGPPGNGKTTIIKALANEMGLPVYPLNTGNIGSSYIHQLARNAQEVRDQLAYKFKMTGERSILFMDEAQQLIPRTSGAMMAHSHNVEETNFFKDMIMTAEQDGIIYAMATNDLNQIEPAFYENSERLGVCIYVGNPDLNSRIGIIGKLLSDRPITKSLNNPESIQKLAEMLEGVSISKISQTVLNIIRNSIKTKTPVTLDGAVETIRKVRLG